MTKPLAYLRRLLCWHRWGFSWVEGICSDGYYREVGTRICLKCHTTRAFHKSEKRWFKELMQ